LLSVKIYQFLEICDTSSGLYIQSYVVKMVKFELYLKSILLYDLPNNNIECPELWSKIGIGVCTHNFSIRNSKADYFLPRALLLSMLLGMIFFFMFSKCFRTKAFFQTKTNYYMCYNVTLLIYFSIQYLHRY